MHCPTCDAELADNTRFCANCGTALTAASQSASPLPPASLPTPSGSVVSTPPSTPSYSSISSAPPGVYQISPGQYIQPVRITSTNAVISFIAGIAGWTFLPVIGAIVAVIFGRMAKKEIRASNGMLQGEAFATIGLVVGIAELGLLTVGLCGAGLLFFLQVVIPIVFRAWLYSGVR